MSRQPFPAAWLGATSSHAHRPAPTLVTPPATRIVADRWDEAGQRWCKFETLATGGEVELDELGLPLVTGTCPHDLAIEDDDCDECWHSRTHAAIARRLGGAS